MPLERFLSRHRRASLLMPITFPMNKVSRLLGYDEGIVSTTMNSIISGAMMGQEEYKIESFRALIAIVMKPIEMFYRNVSAIIHYIIRGIGSLSGKAMGKALDLGIQFLKIVFLPGLRTTLNTLDGTGLLPPQIHLMIVAFNMIYGFLQMIGYLPK